MRIEIDFPDPAVTNPFLDPTGQWWGHDGDGWLALMAGADGGLPPGGVDDDVLTKVGTAQGVATWSSLNPGQF